MKCGWDTNPPNILESDKVFHSKLHNNMIARSKQEAVWRSHSQGRMLFSKVSSLRSRSGVLTTAVRPRHIVTYCWKHQLSPTQQWEHTNVWIWPAGYVCCWVNQSCPVFTKQAPNPEKTPCRQLRRFLFIAVSFMLIRTSPVCGALSVSLAHAKSVSAFSLSLFLSLYFY